LRIETTRGKMADVKPEEAGEEGWVEDKDFEDAGSQERGTIEQEHGAGHEVREAMDGGVGGLVLGQVVDFERCGKSEGLAEAEGEAFAGDGVDGAGGVADEGDVAVGDAMKSPTEGNSSAWGVPGDG
jgi:hypothetical protein